MHRRIPPHPHREVKSITRGRTIRWANHYDLAVKVLTLGRENQFRTETIRHAAIRNGDVVLDAGCGTGTLTLLAKAAAGNRGLVFGVDASPEMITVARQKSQQQKGIEFTVGVIEALEFSDKTFDIVLSSLMFHHLPDDLKERGLKEMYLILKPGGRLIVVDMVRPATFFQRLSVIALAHHEQTTDVRDLLPIMENIGFRDVQSSNMSWKMLGLIRGSRAREQFHSSEGNSK